MILQRLTTAIGGILLAASLLAQSTYTGPVQLRRMTLTAATGSSEVLRAGQVCVIINADPASEGHNRIYVGNGANTLAQLVAAGRYVMPKAEDGASVAPGMAFVHSGGDNGSAVIGNPSKPFESVEAAITALSTGGVIVCTELTIPSVANPTVFPSGTWTLMAPHMAQMLWHVNVDGGVLNISDVIILGDLTTVDGGMAYATNVTADAVTVSTGGIIGMGIRTGNVSVSSGMLEIKSSIITDVTLTGSFELYARGVNVDGNITFYSDEGTISLDRTTILGGITNAAFSLTEVEAYNVVTTNDTAGQMLNITGLGNCFACTDGGGGGGDTPTLTEVLTEGNATSGQNIVVSAGDSIDFVHGAYIGRLTKAALTAPRAWGLPNNSGYLGLVNSSTGAITYLDVAGLGPMATSSNPSDLAQEGATDGQVLTWDNTAGEWVPETPSGGGGTPGLADVLTVSNSTGSNNIIIDAGQGVAFRAATGVGGTAITGPATTDNSYTATLQPADGTIAYTSDIPANATYITQTAHAGLSNEQALSSLSTGIVKVTTGTGVLSTATAGDFPTLNQSTTGSAATLTTSRTFQTNLASTSAAGFNGSANNSHGVTGTLPVTNGGTGRATSTTAYGLIAAGTTATGAQQTLATGTSGQTLVSGGSAALPTWQTPVARSVGVMPMASSYYAWSNMPSAETFFNAQARWVYPIDLTNATMIRVVVTMPNPGALPANGSKIRIKYKTEASGLSTTIGDYSSLAASGQVEATMSNAMGVYSSSWTAIAAGAKTTVILAVAGVDGDGTADPQFGSITIDYY